MLISNRKILLDFQYKNKKKKAEKKMNDYLFRLHLMVDM